MITVDFSETMAASDLKVGRCRHLIEIMKVPYVSIEGQGHFLTIYFPGFVCTRPRYQVSVYRTIGPLVYVLCFTRPRYQVSVYRTNGPLLSFFDENKLSKQNSPRWDAAFCGVTSGAILFAFVP